MIHDLNVVPVLLVTGARWWANRSDHVSVEDHVVQTESRPVGEIAREVLRLADWLP